VGSFDQRAPARGAVGRSVAFWGLAVALGFLLFAA
jgi:hypothetical protein